MASVELYIKNYKSSDGTIVTSETLFQTIPMAGDPVITNPKVKTDLGKAGSFEFGLELYSPLYDALLQMKTIIRIVYFGETIFRGRVLTIDKTFSRTRTVHCEGDLAFLLDSHQIGVKDDNRPETDLLTYLNSVISQHNADVADPDKQFVLGEVPLGYSASVLDEQKVKIPEDKAIQRYGNSSYDTSMDRLESLLGDFGGYMRTRYDSSTGTTYLDWYDNYYNPYIGQDIEVLSNLIDLSGPTEVENLFTVVLPIGKKNNGEVYIDNWWPQVKSGHAKVNYITVPELATVPLYSDGELTSGYHRKEDYANAINRFGRIWKTVEFENANTPQKLFTYCKDWIKNNFMPELTQWDVTALDLKYVGSQIRALYTGDRIKLVHPEVDRDYMVITIISSEYDLFSPDKNKFKIGVPNQQINASYGVKQKTKDKNKNVNSGITNLPSVTDDLEKQIQENLNKIQQQRDILQQQYILKTDFGNDILLDNPFSFVVYENDGNTIKPMEDTISEFGSIIQSLIDTKFRKRTQVEEEAERRGVSPNDPQLLIDLTPDVKDKQRLWKADTAIYITNTLGLSQQEADLLLNDSVSSSWLASLVDDNGNWTQAALERGAMAWAEPEKIRKMAIDTRNLMTGKTEIPNGSVLSTAMPWLVGGNLNLSNYLSFDGENHKFDLGNIFNTGEISNVVTGLKDNVVSMLGGWINGIDLGSLGNNFKFDVGSLINTQELQNTVSGAKDKVVSFINGLVNGSSSENGAENQFNFDVSNIFNVEEIQNTVSGLKNKAINFIGGLLRGNSSEKEGSEDVNKSVDILSGLLTGSDKQTELTGEKEKALNIINGLLSGRSKEKDGSDDVDKTVDILSGLVTGSDKKTGSTGFGEQALNIINGLLTGTSKEKDGSNDVDKSIDILSGLLTGSDQQTESAGGNKMFDFLSGLFTGEQKDKDGVVGAIKNFYLGNDYAEIDGEKGTASFGDGYEWMVKLNDTVDKVSGFVSAKDFQTINDIPSFKTQFAAIKTLFADQATFNSTTTTNLAAVEAYINAISSATIDADKYVSAGHGSFNTLNATSSATANSFIGGSFTLTKTGADGKPENSNLGDCFQSAGTKFEDGVWTLVLYKIGGGSQDVPFDLTATDWYKDQIAGSVNTGWDNAAGVVSIPNEYSISSGTISISTPFSHTLNGETSRGTDTNTYTLLSSGQNDVVLNWDQGNDGEGIIVAKFTHNQYTLGRDSVTVGTPYCGDTNPELGTGANDIRVSINITAKASNGETNFRNYTLSHSTYNGSDRCVNLIEAGKVIGRIRTQNIYTTGVTDGGNNVTVTSISRIAECAFDKDEETATQTVRLTLSNGKKVDFVEDFSDIYKAGLNSETIDTTVKYEAEFKVGNMFIKTEEDDEDNMLHLDLSDVYLQGVHDATPAVLGTYTYDPNGELIDTFKMLTIGGTITMIKSSTQFYPNTPVTRSEASLAPSSYTRFVYDGTAYYALAANIIDSASSTPCDSKYGNKIGIYVEEAPYELASVEINWLQHGTYVNDIPTYLDPRKGESKSYVSSYSGNYSSINCDTGVDIGAFLTPLRTNTYGRYANSTALPDSLEQKVNFTATYSNGTESYSETYTVKISTYEMEGQQVDYGYRYVYASGNEGRCRFYVTIGDTSSSHWVSCNSYVHLEEDPTNPQDEYYVKVKYNGTIGYVSKGLLNTNKKNATGDGYPRARTSGWADNEYIVGAFSSGFNKSARVGVQSVKGGRLYATDLYGSRSDVVTNMGTGYLCDYGPPVDVYSSQLNCIGRTCNLVLSDASILPRSYTIKDENA